MKFFSFSLIGLLFSACTMLGSSDDNLRGGGSDAGCDRTGSGLSCQVDNDCASDEECEHRTCQLHGSVCGDDDRDGGDDDDGGGGGSGSGSDDPQGSECVVDADCGAGLECEDGLCKPHGGN